MSDPIFGIVTRTVDDQTLPISFANMDVVGLIGPADDADDDTFPLETPVMFNSSDSATIALLGVSNSSQIVKDAIRGTNDQMASYQRAVQMVFVRTALGANADPNVANQLTIAGIMGDSSAGTGLNAFALSAEMVHAIPRLIMAPGYTGLLADGVDSIVPGTAGAGYTPLQSYPLTFSGGGANVVQATGHVIANEDGTLGAPIIDTPGAWYTAIPTIAVASPGTGGGKVQATFTATTDALANPIVSALPTILDQLIAHAVVESAGTSYANDLAFRQTIDCQRIIAVSGGCKVTDPTTGDTVVRSFAPRVIGAMVAVDFQNDGTPFHSAANQAIQGIIGPARSMSFNITDGANEGQELLAVNMGILVAGDLGDDFAIAQAGYIFIGTDNCGDDPEFMFYNVSRGRDYINLALIRTLRYYLGKFNITVQCVKAVVNTMANLLRDLKANDNLIGYAVNFSGSLNSADQIRAGNIVVSFQAEEPTVLRKITTQGSRYAPSLDALISQLESQLSIAA